MICGICMAHTPMHEIDWHKLYLLKRKGKLEFDAAELGLLREIERPFLSLVEKYVEKGGKVLDAGAGLGRMALLLSFGGYEVTAVDADARMLEAAENNVARHGGKATFIRADLRNLPFNKNSFDAIVHQGILEHFSGKEAMQIIDHHLSVAPIVIFSVPIGSPHTKKYFSIDAVERNLLSAKEWLKILEPFRLLDHMIARQRTENLIAVLSR